MQLEVGLVSRVDRGHEGLGISGVPKPQGMAQFVGCNNAKVHPLVGPLSPELIFIKVHAAQLWDVSMGQDPPCTKAKVDRKEVRALRLEFPYLLLTPITPLP